MGLAGCTAGPPEVVVGGDVCASGAISEARFPGCFVDAHCADPETYGARAYFDVEQCRAYYLVGEGARRFESHRLSALAGRMRYDALAAARCVRERAPLGLPPVCAQVHVPIVPGGGECYRADECVPPGGPGSADCVRAPDAFRQCAPGRCGPSGQPLCPDEPCAYGWVCQIEAMVPDVRRCVRGDVGDACLHEGGCHGASSCVDGVCVRPRRLGESCLGLDCDPGLWCLPDDGDFRCQAVDKVGAVCDGLCANRLVCVHGSDDSLGRCQALPTREDASCEPRSGCAVPLVCDGLTRRCRPGRTLHLGEECLPAAFLPANDRCLYGTFCDRRAPDRPATCAPQLTDGTPCDAHAQCRSGRCSDEDGYGLQCTPLRRCP